LFLLVFIRFTGAFFFNPLFARKSVPFNIKAGMALLCAMLVTGTLDVNVGQIGDLLTLAILGAKELLIGFISGVLMDLLLSVAVISGELMDLQLGVSMSKIYDPQSNVSMPLSGTLLNLLLTLTFFLSNGHLTLIRIITLSFRIFPPGTALLGAGFAKYVTLLFGQILIIALKLALPVIAVELMSEFGLGVLMRTAPQINVFSVGLQLRVLLGMTVVLLTVPSIAHVMDAMTGYLYERMEYVFRLMS